MNLAGYQHLGVNSGLRVVCLCLWIVWNISTNREIRMYRWIVCLALALVSFSAPAFAQTCGFPDRIGVISDSEAKQVEAQLNSALIAGGFGKRATGGRVLKQLFFDLPSEMDLSDKRHIAPVGDYVVIEKIMGISTGCRVIAAFTKDAGRRQGVTEPYNLRVEKQANKDAPFEDVGVFRQGMSGGFPGPGRYRLTVQPIGIISPFNIAAPTRFVTVTSPGLKRTAGILQIQIKNPAASGVVGTGFVIGGQITEAVARAKAHCKPVRFTAEVKVGEIISETNSNVFSRNTRIQRYGNASWELHKNGKVIERAGPQGSFQFDPLVLGDGGFQLFAALDEADQGKGPSAFRPRPVRHAIQVFKCGEGDGRALQAQAEQAAADAAAGRAAPIKDAPGPIADPRAGADPAAGADANGKAPAADQPQAKPPNGDQPPPVAPEEAQAALEQAFDGELAQLEEKFEDFGEDLEVKALDGENKVVLDVVLEPSRFIGEPAPPPRDDIVVPNSCAACEAEIARHRRLLRKSCGPAVNEMLGFFEDIAKYDAIQRAIEADHFLSVLEPLRVMREPQILASNEFGRIIEFAVNTANALQSQGAQAFFAEAQRVALQLDVKRRAKNPDALFIPPMIGGLIEQRFAEGIFAFGLDMSGVIESKELFAAAVADFNAVQGGDFRNRVESFIVNDLAEHDFRFSERLVKLFEVRDGFQARRQRMSALFRSGEFEHCLGGPATSDAALKAVPGMNFVLPDQPDRGTNPDVFRAAAILPPVFEIPVKGFEDFFPVRFKLDGDERLEFEEDLRERITAVEGAATLVAIESGAVLLGDFLLAFANTATGKLFLDDNDRVQRFNEGLNNLAPAVATVLGDFFGDDPERLDRALAELDIAADGELTPRQKIDLLKAHPNVAVRTAAAALDLIIIQPGTQIGEGIGTALAQTERTEAESLEEEIFRFRLESDEQVEITEGAIEGAFLAFDLGIGKAAVTASKKAITVGKKIFASTDDAIIEINALRRAKGLGPLDESAELTLKGAQDVVKRSEELAEARRVEAVLQKRIDELAQQADTAKVSDAIVDGITDKGDLSNDAQALVDDILARARATSDELVAEAKAAELAAKQADEAAERVAKQAEEQAQQAEQARQAELARQAEKPPEANENKPEPAQPEPPVAEQVAKADENPVDVEDPEAAKKQAEADDALDALFGDRQLDLRPLEKKPPVQQGIPPQQATPDPKVAANPKIETVEQAKTVFDDVVDDIDEAAAEAKKASDAAARKLQEELAEQFEANPLPKAKVEERLVELDAAEVQRLQADPESLFGRGSEGEVLKLVNADGTTDALKLINQVTDASGKFDPVAAKKIADDAIETGKRLEKAGANLAPIKGQGTTKAKLPGGGEADVPFLIVDAFPPGTRELADLLIPDPNKPGKKVLAKLTREQQIELLRQFDLAAKEGLVLLDSNPGNLLLNGTPGKVTGSFGETGGFFDALDPNTARAVQAERLFGSQTELANLAQSQLKANRIARETGAPKINISEIAAQVPRGGQGLLDQFDAELIEAFKDADAFEKLLDEFDRVEKPQLAAADAKRIEELKAAAKQAGDATEEIIEVRDALAELAQRLEDPNTPVAPAPLNVSEVATRLAQVDEAIETTRQAVIDAAAKQFDANKRAADIADKAEETVSQAQKQLADADVDALKADELQAELSNAVADALRKPASPPPPGGSVSEQPLQVNQAQLNEILSQPPVGRGQTANVFDANPQNPGQQVVKFFDKSGFQLSNSGNVILDSFTNQPTGAFDQARALGIRDDQLAGAAELSKAKVNFLDVTGQGIARVRLPDGNIADAPFLTQEFLPNTAQVLDGVKRQLDGQPLPRAQQLAILEQLDLAAREGLLLGDANAGNIFLDVVDGRATAGFVETGNVLNVGDPDKARRFIADLLFGEAPGSNFESAFRLVEALKGAGLDPGLLNDFQAFGGVGTLGTLISPDLKAAFNNKELLQAAFRGGNESLVADLAKKADEAGALATGAAVTKFDAGAELSNAREKIDKAQKELSDLQGAVAQNSDELARLKAEKAFLNDQASDIVDQANQALIQDLTQQADALDPKSTPPKIIPDFGRQKPPEAPGAGAGQ